MIERASLGKQDIERETSSQGAGVGETSMRLIVKTAIATLTGGKNGAAAAADQAPRKEKRRTDTESGKNDLHEKKTYIQDIAATR